MFNKAKVTKEKEILVSKVKPGNYFKHEGNIYFMTDVMHYKTAKNEKGDWHTSYIYCAVRLDGKFKEFNEDIYVEPRKVKVSA